MSDMILFSTEPVFPYPLEPKWRRHACQRGNLTHRLKLYYPDRSSSRLTHDTSGLYPVVNRALDMLINPHRPLSLAMVRGPLTLKRIVKNVSKRSPTCMSIETHPDISDRVSRFFGILGHCVWLSAGWSVLIAQAV